MTDRQKIEKLKLLNSQIKNKQKEVLSIDEDLKLRKKQWITYFRKNIPIYIEKRLRFHSFGYQNFSYHLMNEANQYMETSTRGVGKSLRATMLACARALLYPNSKIGVTAVGASQANENYLTAFMQEIVFKYSPYMKWLYENKLFTSRETDKGYTVTFWNGSIIYFFPCINSSRGKIIKKYLIM